MSRDRRKVGRVLQALSALCGGIAGLLGVRILFRLLLADPANPVTTAVSAITGPLLFPWDRLWPPTTLPIVTVERAALVGVVVYVAVGVALAFLGQACARSEEKAR